MSPYWTKVQYTCATVKAIFTTKSAHAQITSVYGIFIWIRQMSSKPVSSELTQAPSFASRLFFFVNKKRLKIWLWVTLSVLLVVACIYVEIQTSLLQSWFFTRNTEELSDQLTEGPSTEIAFARSGPFDDRRGYSKLPACESQLEAQGYQVTQQVHQSEKMVQLIKRGISPPYVEPPETGLDIR